MGDLDGGAPGHRVAVEAEQAVAAEGVEHDLGRASPSASELLAQHPAADVVGPLADA